MPDEHKFDDNPENKTMSLSRRSSRSYSFCSDDKDDLEGKEDKLMARGDSFYMISKGNDMERFDSADWVLAQEKEKQADRAPPAAMKEGLDELVDFDEEPPERSCKVPSEGPCMGARVTARRLLSKHSTGSSGET